MDDQTLANSSTAKLRASLPGIQRAITIKELWIEEASAEWQRLLDAQANPDDAKNLDDKIQDAQGQLEKAKRLLERVNIEIALRQRVGRSAHRLSTKL